MGDRVQGIIHAGSQAKPLIEGLMVGAGVTVTIDYFLTQVFNPIITAITGLLVSIWIFWRIKILIVDHKIKTKELNSK